MMPDPLSSTDGKHVWVCDGCSSWTDKPVTLNELLDGWGWIQDAVEAPCDQPGEGVFCPDCQ